MPSLTPSKELANPPLSLFLVDCVFPSGEVEHLCTHQVEVAGISYVARILGHSQFDLGLGSEDGLDGSGSVRLRLANADSYFSQIERNAGFRGARVLIKQVFFDFATNSVVEDPRIVFRGVGNTPDETTETECTVTFQSRLNLQRILLPDVRIQRRCPWSFPGNQAERAVAVSVSDRFSGKHRCGYSAGETGGRGSVDPQGAPYTACDYTRAACETRGMFDHDAFGNVTRRFGGIEFVPSQIVVRSAGESGSHLSVLAENTSRYNDFVPLVYGTAWYAPPVVFARNDGNLTRTEVLLGMGEIDSVVKVVVNDIEIPEAQEGHDMTATGWYKVVSPGGLGGAFNLDFTDALGHPLGDPYGSMAVASVVVPTKVASGQTIPKIRVLVRGLKLDRYNGDGTFSDTTYSNNPAWVLLDVLRRSGWQTSEIDLASFASTATYCEGAIQIDDGTGNTATVPRFQCNIVFPARITAAQAVRGIRAGAGLMLSYGVSGLLQLRPESSIGIQHPSKPAGSNSTETINGGWPAYEFSDGTAAFSGILRKSQGEPSIRMTSRNSGDSPNRLTVEFQDELNAYQQDSLTLVDFDDASATAREVTAASPALGLPNFDQAARVLRLQLSKNTIGNVYVDFETSIKGRDLVPGDLITITYQKEGLSRQLFRIVRLTPGQNYHTVRIIAQWHEDEWYTNSGSGGVSGIRGSGVDAGLPMPLGGTHENQYGQPQFDVAEAVIPNPSGGSSVRLTVSYQAPGIPNRSIARPRIDLAAQVSSTGGTLAGGRTLYYAVAAVNDRGEEGQRSFTVRVVLPAGNNNSVTLTGLRFGAGASTFYVYRGATPQQMARIDGPVPISASYLDSGRSSTGVPAADPNYDHANFYWRWQQRPETQVSTADSYSITTGGLGASVNEHRGAVIRIARGLGVGQERIVESNTATSLQVSRPWTTIPDATSFYTISDSTWNLGGLSSASPAVFEVPNRPGSSLEISGRSANGSDQETSATLNPITTWQLTGGAGGGDQGSPPRPVFALDAGGQGNLILSGLGFDTLAGTHTISAGTLTVWYWNELQSPTAHALTAAVSSADTTFGISGGTVAIGDVLQLGGEIARVASLTVGGCVVTRAEFGSAAASYAAGTSIYLLQKRVQIVPIARGLIGSQASGDFSQDFYLPDVRVAAAELFMTNDFGPGPARSGSFGYLSTDGIRTLSGGQLVFHVDGYLAIQNDAAGPIAMDATHAVRDLYAIVSNAPSGGSVTVRISVDGSEYCRLNVPDSQLVSGSVSGFGKHPFSSGSRITVDILDVPNGAGSLPGKDLTVIVRF